MIYYNGQPRHRHLKTNDVVRFQFSELWYRITDVRDSGLYDSDNITDEIEKWMKENEIKYPFKDKEEEMIFNLRFG